MSKREKKKTLDKAIDFTQFKLDNLERQYDNVSKKYAHMVNIGVGLTAIEALDTIRSLLFLYTDIAAHRDALRSMKVDINS
jgi:hypothetical protein